MSVAAIPALRPVVMRITVTAVVEQVQQRTGCQQQEWQDAEQVRTVFRDQEIAADGGKCDEYDERSPSPAAIACLVRMMMIHADPS